MPAVCAHLSARCEHRDRVIVPFCAKGEPTVAHAVATLCPVRALEIVGARPQLGKWQ